MSTNYSNTLNELVQGVLTHGPEVLDNCIVDQSVDLEKYLSQLVKEHLNYPFPKTEINKDRWFVPESYMSMDIESHLISQCPPSNLDRLALELELYRQYNMTNILRVMKYLVDTLRKNNIVWGVGRGSSVASYALHLLGVHKIDSVKYNIPIEEFFKGE